MIRQGKENFTSKTETKDIKLAVFEKKSKLSINGDDMTVKVQR